MSSGGALLLSLLLLLSAAPLHRAGDVFDTCSRYTSFGYGYRDLFEFREGNASQNNEFYLEFYVKTSSDAHILLKPEISVERGYEIVIGGGSNTFSQIRLLQPEAKQTLITQKTEHFLSGEEYRHFWVSIDKLGIISVGKKVSDEVFINWRIDDPFPIRYFAFGSWTNMKADWRFGCGTTDDSAGQEVVEEDGGLSPLQKLKRDLFSLYDPNALPVEHNATLEVKANFQIGNVLLDEKRGDLTMYGTADLKWSDGKIRWQPEIYEGIDNIFVSAFEIWTPSIRVLNALAVDRNPVFDLTTTGVVVKHDGSVFWRPAFKSVSQCAVDLKYWPNDVHNCSVLLGFWMEPPNLVLSMMEEYDTLSEDRTDSQWEVIRAMPFNTNHEDEDENYGILYVELKRGTDPYMAVMFVPSAAAILMTLTSFWLPLNNPLKLHLIFAGMLLLLLLMFLAGAMVPAMTHSVPKIIELYSWNVVISSVPILLYVAMKNVQSRLQVPDGLSRFLNNQLFVEVFCLPDLNEMTTEYSNLSDEVDKRNKDRLNSVRLMTVIERLCFLVYLLAVVLLCELI